MAEYIGCRNCKSPDCKGCNLKNLETMLNNGKFDCLMDGNRCINPATDVGQVVHARWIGAPLCGNDNCRCSNCGSWHNIHANLRGKITQKYCPSCGAKMDGGAN